MNKTITLAMPMWSDIVYTYSSEQKRIENELFHAEIDPDLIENANNSRVKRLFAIRNILVAIGA